MKHRLSITLSEDVLNEIERRRGIASKSALVEHELRKSFNARPNAERDQANRGY